MTTIDEALDAFLAEQEERLAEPTYRNYLQVIELFRDCMNGYGHNSLSELERRWWQRAFDARQEEAFTHLFAPRRRAARPAAAPAAALIDLLWRAQQVGVAHPTARLGNETSVALRWLTQEVALTSLFAPDELDGTVPGEMPNRASQVGIPPGRYEVLSLAGRGCRPGRLSSVWSQAGTPTKKAPGG